MTPAGGLLLRACLKPIWMQAETLGVMSNWSGWHGRYGLGSRCGAAQGDGATDRGDVGTPGWARQVVESAGVGRQEHAQELVLEGVQRALDDRDLTSAHATVLEQIVLPYYRPVIDVRNDSFERRPPAWESLDRHRAVIEAAIPSVGRIELTGHPNVSWAGTGFLIGNDLLLTARHVAELFTRGVSPRRLRFLPGRGSAIDFKREVEGTTPAPPPS